MAKTTAPEGTIWLCHACGKLSRDRYEDTERSGWDESCMLRAVLIDAASIERNERGKVIKAKAIPMEQWPDWEGEDDATDSA